MGGKSLQIVSACVGGTWVVLGCVFVSWCAQVCQLEVGVLSLGRLGEDLLIVEDAIGNRDRKKQLMAALRASIGEIADLFRDVLQVLNAIMPPRDA